MGVNIEQAVVRICKIKTLQSIFSKKLMAAACPARKALVQIAV